MTDQDIINLFSDLIPAPTKIHVVVPQPEGQIIRLEGSSKTDLLFEKGGLVVGIGKDVYENFDGGSGDEEGGLGIGDRVFLGGHFFAPEFVVTREGHEMLVVDSTYVSCYKKGS